MTGDITGAYLNIPHGDANNCLHEALEERHDKSVPSSFLIKIMDLIQRSNISEFHDGQLWKQLIGVVMGIHPTPNIANTYIARRLDEEIKKVRI